MTICIFTEDSLSKSGKAYEVLATKILGRQKVRVKSLQRAELLNAAKLKIHLANFKNPNRVSRAIICIDSHSDPAGMAPIADSARMKLADLVQFPVEYVIVVHALESWLLEDSNALQKVLGIRLSGRQLTRMRGSCQPDQALKSFCAYFDKYFNKSVHDALIAQEVDVDLVSLQNSSFQQFVDAIRGRR